MNCKDVAQLASESLDRSLTFYERMTLRLHLFRCEMCTRYVHRLKFLQRACADADEEKLTDAAELTDEARERIRIQLSQE